MLFIVLEPNYLHQLSGGTRTAESMAVFQTLSSTRVAGDKGSGYVTLGGAWVEHGWSMGGAWVERDSTTTMRII